MSPHLLSTFIFLILVSQSLQSEKHNKKIAIIGSGISGLGTAFYLSELLENKKETDPEIQIDIFESSDETGGRIKTLKIDKDTNIDVGASFFIKENKLLTELIEKLEIPFESALDPKAKKVIMDKTDTLVKLDGPKFLDMMKLFYRYNLAPIHANQIFDEFLVKFGRVYDHLANGKSFDSLDDFTQFMGISHIADMTAREFLKDKLNERFIDEFLRAFIYSTYNQSVDDINAFSGLVILAAAIKEGYKIKDGNICMINRIKDFLKGFESIDIKLSSPVKEVKRQSNKFTINNSSEEYDYIVIATNLYDRRIKFYDYSNEIPYEVNQTQVRAIEVIVKGSFKHYSVGLDSKFEVLLFKEPFGRQEILDIINFKDNHYKIFMNKEPDQSLLEQIFENLEILESKTWDFAYPFLKPLNKVKSNLDFTLDSSLYKSNNSASIFYTNTIEFLSSCMEMSLISAKNTANRIISSVRKPLNQVKYNNEL